MQYHYTHPHDVKKQCPKCKTYKPITQFSLHKNKKDKRDTYCKDCYKKAYKQKREDRIAQMIINQHKQRGYKINITKEDIKALRQQYNNTKCPICNKTMKIQPYTTKKITKDTGKNSPSIDIINPKNKTMDKNNIWVICKECNLLKSNMTPIQCHQAAKKLEKIYLHLNTA